MSDSPYARPFVDWPLILCGPILRRVTSSSVCVFIALKEAAAITLQVTDEAGTAMGSGTGFTRALGPNLYVLAVEAACVGLVLGETYLYDLEIVQHDAAELPLPAKTLASLLLLEGDVPLGYVTDLKPSFSLPPALENLHVIHGSCRMAQGKGHDMLAVVDGLIEDSRITRYPDALLRPHQLLLTGDQIYADDVAVPLAMTVRDTAIDLCIRKNASGILDVADLENIPVLGIGDVNIASPEVVPGAFRKYFVKNHTQLTGEAEGHLIFMAEFYALYLLMWSDALWPRDANGHRDLPWRHPWWTWCGEREDDAVRKSVLKYFTPTLRRVRRALANVPTYMIFDDHDVTDDWNLTRDWRERVIGNSGGQRIIRNALVGYAVFQDWGNQPENYAVGGIGRQILNAIDWSETTPPQILSNPHMLDNLFDIAPTRPSIVPARMRWDWKVEAHAHRVIALDGRTWRGFPSGTHEPEAPVAVISSSGLETQLDPRVLPHTVKLSLVISPGPVSGMPTIELGQALINPWMGPREFDNEAWAGDAPALLDLLRRLARFGVVILLSGDVHYAFSNYVDWLDTTGPVPRRARLVQLCASSLKNEGELGPIATLTNLPRSAVDVLMVEPGDATRRLAAEFLAALPHLPPPPSVPNSIDLHTSVHHALLLLGADERCRRKLVYAVDVMESSAALAEPLRILTDASARERYRVHFLTDDRSALDRRAPLAGWPDPPLLDLHTLDVNLDVILRFTRTIVGFANLGQLTFRAGASGSDPVTLLHRLFWAAHCVQGNDPLCDNPDGLAPLFSTQHQVLLAPPTPDEL